jgi:predicted CXXCH cytochrome family protein
MRMGRSIVIACFLIFVGPAVSGRAAGQAQATAQSAPDDAQSCSPCHGEIVQQLKAHPHAASGKADSCSACHTMDAAHPQSGHDVQASARKQASISEQNAVCTRCHANDAGPFTHEHPVVKVEGCASCHAPHGSANPKMLTAGSESALCLQCHAQNNAQIPHGASREPAAQPVDCTTCHRQIHGSNTSEVFLQ